MGLQKGPRSPVLPDQSLKAGAQARLQAARAEIADLNRQIAAHEEAISALRERLPELQFEEAAMRYIVEGSSASSTQPNVSATSLRKVSRQELIELIKHHLGEQGRAVEVGELHAYLAGPASVDLGPNARNYLCGVLSRGKDVHFANVGKGAWWLAGRPVPPDA